MSSQLYRDHSVAEKFPFGGVHVELFGGSQDGELLNTNKRWDYITYPQKISIQGSQGASEEVRTIETLYEYCGYYRLCKGYGRIYKYRFSEVKVHEPGEPRKISEDINCQEGLSEYEGVQPEDLLGTHGGDECLDEPSGC